HKPVVRTAGPVGAAAALETCRYVVVREGRAGDCHRSGRRGADAVTDHGVVILLKLDAFCKIPRKRRSTDHGRGENGGVMEVDEESIVPNGVAVAASGHVQRRDRAGVVRDLDVAVDRTRYGVVGKGQRPRRIDEMDAV